MPKILELRGIRLVIFPNDHEPPHVHAIGADWHVKMTLGNGEESRPRLLEIKYGNPKKRDLRNALELTHEHSSALWNTWRKLHG